MGGTAKQAGLNRQHYKEMVPGWRTFGFPLTKVTQKHEEIQCPNMGTYPYLRKKLLCCCTDSYRGPLLRQHVLTLIVLGCGAYDK